MGGATLPFRPLPAIPQADATRLLGLALVAAAKYGRWRTSCRDSQPTSEVNSNYRVEQFHCSALAYPFPS